MSGAAFEADSSVVCDVAVGVCTCSGYVWVEVDSLG